MNRTDWIESDTTKLNWLDWIGPNALYGPIELKQIFRIVSPMLGGNKIPHFEECWNQIQIWLQMLPGDLEFAKYFLNLKICISSRLKIDWDLTRRVKVDQKVNECSQRPPIGPNGSKLDMGGPEGSIYPYLKVRPWFKVIWGQKVENIWLEKWRS